MRFVLAAAVVLGCRGERAPEPAPEPPPAPQKLAASTAPTPKPAEPQVKPHREDLVVECPVALTGTDDDAKAALLLEEANKQIALGTYGAAWMCADRAADLVPSSVEAHHLRGAALAGLGKERDAQLAYSLALSLDPDDPETLRAVADFYINGHNKAERGRDALRLGFELAQRGSKRVVARRRKNAQLASDLAVLEAQALNDLGRSDEALVRIDAALKLTPNRADALHEKGVALFDLSRFVEAKHVLERAMIIQPDDGYTHQILGLTLEQLGDIEGGEAHLAKAVKLAPKDLAPAVLIPLAEFRLEVEAIIESLAEDRRKRVRAVRIEIVDLPDPADLTAVKPPFPPTILGLYRGPAGGVHTVPTKDQEKPSIVLYRKNLGRAVKTRAELSEQIRDTLLHEIGHLEGLDEDDLRRRGME